MLEFYLRFGNRETQLLDRTPKKQTIINELNLFLSD